MIIFSFFSISSQFIYFFTQNTDVALTVCIIGGVGPLSLSSMLSRYNVSYIGNVMIVLKCFAKSILKWINVYIF